MFHRVFVYGSLKNNYHNNFLLVKHNAEFICETRTTDSSFNLFAMAGGSFPAVTYGEYSINGELYIVDEDALNDLDRLEGNGHFYNRELVNLVGEEEPAWMYIIMRCESRSRYNVDVCEVDDTTVLNWGDLAKMKNNDWLNYRSIVD